jgi:hypothetical protein
VDPEEHICALEKRQVWSCALEQSGGRSWGLAGNIAIQRQEAKQRGANVSW